MAASHGRVARPETTHGRAGDGAAVRGWAQVGAEARAR